MTKPPFNDETNAGRNNPFLDTVEWVGQGNRPWGPGIRSKRKFARGGSFTEWPDKQGITVTWEKMGWNLSPEGRYGMLCIIAWVGGKWMAWNIEHLRKATEETGTMSVNTDGWPDARDWVDVVAQKTNSPDRDFRFANGDWFGLMIVPHPEAEPKVQNVRTDILEVQYEGGEDPPPPDDRYNEGYNDAIIDMAAALEDLVKK